MGVGIAVAFMVGIFVRAFLITAAFLWIFKKQKKVGFDNLIVASVSAYLFAVALTVSTAAFRKNDFGFLELSSSIAANGLGYLVPCLLIFLINVYRFMNHRFFHDETQAKHPEIKYRR